MRQDIPHPIARQDCLGEQRWFATNGRNLIQTTQTAEHDRLVVAPGRAKSSQPSNPLLTKDEMTPKDIAEFMGMSDLQVSLANVDVRKWFIEGNTDKDMVRAVVESALDRLRKIIEEDKTGPKEAVTAAAQVNACKIVLEMADFAPPKQKVIEYADKEVGEMTEEALLKFIADKTKKLQEVK